jgi:hypothetical protein
MRDEYLDGMVKRILKEFRDSITGSVMGATTYTVQVSCKFHAEAIPS